MPTTEESWEAYFYPETIDRRTGQGVLRNLFGERDVGVLARREYVATFERETELRRDPSIVARTFDDAHVRAIHGYLFQDVYDWAGQYRTVNISKGTPRGFARVESGEIDRYLEDVQRLVTGVEWGELDQSEFVRASAEVFAYLNQAHPFREGNGRTSKVFMSHVAELSRFRFEFGRVGVQAWNEASMYSGPDRFSYEPHYEELLAVFRQASVERQ